MTMSDEGFLRRWARRKSELRTEVREGRASAPESAPESALEAAPSSEPAIGSSAEAQAIAAYAAPQPAAPQPSAAPEATAEAAQPLPTMEDVAALDKDSDFSAFLARGVDAAVRRGALKKLFADPHFNVMDKLDVYIDDYTKPSPMSEAMLASLEHAKSVFMKMVEDDPEAAPQTERQAQQPPEQETQ
jgi:hypothetical protein